MIHMIEKSKDVLMTEDPKDFWNMIKKMNSWGNETKEETDKIAAHVWHKYAQSLLNTDHTSPNIDFPLHLPIF